MIRRREFQLGPTRFRAGPWGSRWAVFREWRELDRHLEKEDLSEAVISGLDPEYARRLAAIIDCAARRYEEQRFAALKRRLDQCAPQRSGSSLQP